MSAQILLVEDDANIFQFLIPSLSAKQFRVKHATSLRVTEQLVLEHSFDMVILDLGLPDGNGEEIIRSVRKKSDVPILILSARQEESDKVHCLNIGADDYLMKPFGVQELIARIHVALRRSAMMSMRDHVYKNGDLVINRASGLVSKGQQELHLSPIERDLLMLLATKPGSIFTHAQLLRHVWGEEFINDTHYLRIHFGRLRAKIEDSPASPQLILTELGIGYRLA